MLELVSRAHIVAEVLPLLLWACLWGVHCGWGTAFVTVSVSLGRTLWLRYCLCYRERAFGGYIVAEVLPLLPWACLPGVHGGWDTVFVTHLKKKLPSVKYQRSLCSCWSLSLGHTLWLRYYFEKETSARSLVAVLQCKWQKLCHYFEALGVWFIVEDRVRLLNGGHACGLSIFCTVQLWICESARSWQNKRQNILSFFNHLESTCLY